MGAHSGATGRRVCVSEGNDSDQAEEKDGKGVRREIHWHCQKWYY